MARYHTDGLIGHADMGGLGIGLGVDGNGLDAQALAGAHHSASYFATVRHQHLIEELCRVERWARPHPHTIFIERRTIN